MILLRHHFDLFVTIVILDPIIDEVVIDRAPEDVRPGPLDVDGVVGRASDVQDQRSARPWNICPTNDVLRRLALVLPRVSFYPYLVLGVRLWKRIID